MNAERTEIRADAARWRAVTARDSRCDGAFVFAVTTTGVYCLPSCPSRRPRRDHVEFFTDTRSAERAGYRACKRCAPASGGLRARHADAVKQACRVLEHAKERVPLESLSARVGVSGSHLRRVFKSLTGVTPAQYAAGMRTRRLREGLRGRGGVVEAIRGAGYQSNGRVYERAGKELGMKPGDLKRGGVDSVIRYAMGETSLGRVLVAATRRGVCWISLGNDGNELKAELGRQFPRAELQGGGSDLEKLVQSIIVTIEHPARSVELPLDIQGTAFQLRVWQALREIPAGETRTYLDIAKAAGKPDASRAVARACAANRIAIAIPCHRVIRSDRSISGYRWGAARKAALLQREQRAAS